MRVSEGRSWGEGDAKRDGKSEPPDTPGSALVTLLGKAGAALSETGSAVKNSFAMRARVSVSGKPAGIERSDAGRVVVKSEPCFKGALFGGSLVVMVAADFYVFQRGNGVINQHRR